MKERARTVFAQRVCALVRRIPRGSVLTYKEVAERAGFPGASRAVGTLMKANMDPDVPCHRVIRSDRSVGDYNRGGPAEKARRLREEGVAVDASFRVSRR